MEPNIGYLLSDSSRLLRRTFNDRMRGLGLTSVQARLLLALTKFPGRNQAFYAERIEVEPITLTRIIDRMEQAGWIKRKADPADRRARLLQLTDQSRAIVGQARTIVDLMLEEMLAGFSPSDRKQLAGLLQKVSENLSADHQLAVAENG